MILFIAVVVVVLVWFFYPDHILSRYSGEEGEAGAYGDIFGAVNALFTSLAFALLIYTAMMQREELQLQRLELKGTRRELARTAKSQAELVRLTKEGNDFQKYFRKNDLWPEFKISKFSIAQPMGVRGPAKLCTEVTLTPYSSLRLLGATITINANARLNEDLINEQKGRIISEGESITLQVLHEGRKDLNAVAVYLRFADIDEENHYVQRMGIVNDKVFITRSYDDDEQAATIFGGAV